MKRILIFLLLSLSAISCFGQAAAGQVCFPIIRYNPATYLSDIDSALADPASFECLSADSLQLSGEIQDILEYLSGQDAFIVSLKAGDTEIAPQWIGIKDREQGNLKYLNVEEERIRHSLDMVIEDLYGTLEDYVATWPEDQKHLFYNDPQGLYTFPNKGFATDVVGWGNSENPKNPVKFKAAISYLRTTKPEWNDDTWAADSTEIVNFSESVTGIIIEYHEEKPRFEGQDANHFSKWVNERLTYPDEALEDAATGRVTLQFKIDMFGNLEGVKVLRGRHPALDSIALNVVSSSPEWTPAKNRIGDPCYVVYTFPVIFTPEMMFEAFITKMYNEKLYEDHDFLQKHCSPELLKKLQDAYPYDSDGPAYATWLFRSGMQDSKPDAEQFSDLKTMMLDVKADGDWYVYTALDMGWKVTNRIKMISKDGKIIIEDMDLTAEWAKAFVRNSYLYHWHKTQDVDSTVMAFCELAKHLMPDIQLDPSAIKAYIMSAEKENLAEGEVFFNIIFAGKYYTPLCSCDIYPCMKEQMSKETLAAFYNVYDSWKTDFMTAMNAIRDKCYNDISIDLYGDLFVITGYDVVQYLIKTEK